MFVELRFKTIAVNKKKTSNRVVPILFFSLSPCLPSLFQKPRHSVCTTRNFSTVFDRKGRGGGGGGEAIPFNKSSQNNALKTCKAISRHCQRIVPLRSDEHFAFKEKP